MGWSPWTLLIFIYRSVFGSLSVSVFNDAGTRDDLKLLRNQLVSNIRLCGIVNKTTNVQSGDVGDVKSEIIVIKNKDPLQWQPSNLMKKG